MSETVWQAVSGDISAEPRRLKLKGYDRPVTAYATQMKSA